MSKRWIVTAILTLWLYLTHCDSVNAGTNSQEKSESQLSWNDNQKKLNILMLSTPTSGHLQVPLALGEELVRRGHNVTLILSGDKHSKDAEYVGIKYINNGGTEFVEQLFKRIHDTTEGFVKKLQTLPEVRAMFSANANRTLKVIEDETNLGKKWDIVLGTKFLLALLPCVGDMLKIPAILISSCLQLQPHTYPPWPWSSSIMGGTTDDMTFFERFLNIMERIILPRFIAFMFISPIKNVTDKHCPDLTYSNLATAPAVYLPEIVSTVIGFEFPRTLTPLTHYVGPIQSRSPTPCSPELQNWLDGKENRSVIYISMGSLLSVSLEMAKKLVKGIQKTKFSVIWAIKKSGDFDLDFDPDRFYLDKWLPQLSVLRHPAISIAIMHGGSNGIHESLKNGVPLIALPMMNEQIGNAGRVHNHGLGIHLDRDTFTAEQITQSIQEINSGDYRNNIRTLQKMFTQAGGVDKAADLVEFYAEIGYDHLIPAYAKYNWSWIQYHNADVYSFLIISALITVYIWFRILRYTWSRCCGCKKQKTE